MRVAVDLLGEEDASGFRERDPAARAPAALGEPRLRMENGDKKRRSRPVSRVLSWTVIPLGQLSPTGSSNLPGSDAGHAMLPYSVLLRVGFALPRGVVPARGALLPHHFNLT